MLERYRVTPRLYAKRTFAQKMMMANATVKCKVSVRVCRNYSPGRGRRRTLSKWEKDFFHQSIEWLASAASFNRWLPEFVREEHHLRVLSARP
jgi:hypothetical protein